MRAKLSVLIAGLAAVAVATLATASTASARELKTDGTPSHIDTDHSGYYVWHDGRDLHLRMSSADASTTYRGTLHTHGTFKDLSRDGDRHDEQVRISHGGHTLHFRITPNNDVDGFKVRVEDANAVRLNLRRNGDAAPTDRIWVGGDDEHPDSSRFTLRV